MIKVKNIDHIVLTVADIAKTVAFYISNLGMKEETFGSGRKALVFGNQKFNLHEKGKEFEPKADRPTPGSVDICLICDTPVHEIVDHLKKSGIAILEGPVSRTGAHGKINSVYIRDPDQNLIELSNYL